MLNLIKKFRTILIIGLVVLVIGVVAFYRPKKTINETPLGSPIPWREITPGLTSRQEVIDTLGQPKSETENALIYTSKSPTRDNQIIIQNGTAVLIKEIVAFSEKRSVDEVSSKYGTADTVLYGEGAVNGNYLFVYLKKGVAYLGNPDTRTLLEIWYFAPLSTTPEFIQKWAPDYSEKPVGGSF